MKVPRDQCNCTVYFTCRCTVHSAGSRASQISNFNNFRLNIFCTDPLLVTLKRTQTKSVTCLSIPVYSSVLHNRHMWFSSSVPSGWEGNEICIQNFGLEIFQDHLIDGMISHEWYVQTLAGSVGGRSRWSCWSLYLTFKFRWDMWIQSFALWSFCSGG